MTTRKNLRDEVSCSICLELFQDPVSIHCGHSFCRGCITRSWKGLTINFSCPQCRQTVPQQSLRPNWELANVVEITKGLNLQLAREVEGGEDLCKEHQEALKLFCKEEKTLICVVCDRSKVHRNHSVVPVDEAAQEFKEQIQAQLKLLKTHERDLQASMKDREAKLQDHAERTKAERQKIVAKYKQLREFLEGQESFLLLQLEQLDEEIQNVHGEVITKLQEEITSLGKVIKEMQKICQQPGCELLKDIQATLRRCEREKFSLPPDVCPQLEKKFSNFTKEIAAVKETMEKFRGALKVKYPSMIQVTLDPKTANAELHLSEDLRCVWWGDRRTDLPSNPERFKFHPCVLGSRGFISGWHCWEVEIVGQGVWAMGVVKESLPRDQWFHLSPEEGVWALCVGSGGCKALTSPHPTPLARDRVLQQIRICLDYGKGEVEFYDALSQKLIFAFRQVSFKEETIYPWFRLVGEAHLKLLS